MKIYGANVHDENKISRASYAERIRWVDRNETKILNMDYEFIFKADSRFAFISFCFAYKKYKEGKLVHLPIWLDATCSGIQHFATMLKDEELAISVNVISNPQEPDKVQDIYSEMIEPTHKKLKELSNLEPSFYKLGMVKLNRKLIKPSIMTRTYKVTVKGVANQLITSLEKYTREGILKLNDPKLLNLLNSDDSLDLIKKLNKGEPVINNLDSDLQEQTNLFNDDQSTETSMENKELNKLLNEVLFKVPSFNESEMLLLNYKEVFKLAQIIHESLFIKYLALKQLFEYFVSICLAFTKLDIPIIWYPPSGLTITQRYLKKNSY